MKKIIILILIFLSFLSNSSKIILSKEAISKEIERENKINEYLNFIKLSLNSNLLDKEEKTENEKDEIKVFLPGFEKINFSEKKIKDVDINAVNNKGETPLITAIEHKNNEYLEYLLKNNVNLDIKHPIYGKYPIHIAIHFENIDGLKLLLKKDKKMVNLQNDVDGWTPLQEATLMGNSEIVKMLLDNCANPFLKDFNGHTALDLAINFGKGDIVRLIRNKIKEIRKNGGSLCLN